jgi:hypothetical protein
MLLGIDHLVIAVPDPDQEAGRLAEALGLPLGDGGRHERLGTFNRLIWLGDSYLEIIGVFDPELAAASWLGRPVVGALASGGGLVTWAVATDDIVRDLERRQASGAQLSAPEPGTRVRPDGRTVRWWFSLPETLSPDGPPFLIEHAVDSAEWQQADRAVRAGGPGRLSGLEIGVHDVSLASAVFSTDLGLRPVPWPPGIRFEIGAQQLDVAPARQLPPTVRLALAGRPVTSFDMAWCGWVLNVD